MMQTRDDSTAFLVRYLWTAFVMLLVVGGILVAVGRRDASFQGTLANHSTLLR